MAYGERIQKICNYHKIKNEVFQWDEDKAINLETQYAVKKR